MHMRLVAVLAAVLVLGGCSGRTTGTSPPPGGWNGGWIEARPLRPPQQSVQVGSLYYARERGTDAQTNPIALKPFCNTNLALHGIPLVDGGRVIDLDISGTFEGSGELSGLRTKLLNAGLGGSLTDYYQMTLTNVTMSSVTRSDAERLFKVLSQRANCQGWGSNLKKKLSSFAVYQVESIYTGDVVLTRKQGSGADASLALTLDQLQPALQAEARKALSSTVTGQAMVFAVVTIHRPTPLP